MQGVLSPLVGALVDRVGPRRVMLGGGVLLGVSYLLGSWITALWHLYLVTGVLAAAGACAVGWVPCAALLSRWFARRQGSVMGLAFSGMGVGILVLGPLAQWLITTHGWRQAYFFIGAGTIAALVPLAWFGIRDRPPTPVAPPAETAAARGERRRRGARRQTSAARSPRAPSGHSSWPISSRRWRCFPS